MSVFKYVSESFEELKSNVTWPEWAEVQKYTVAVAVFSVVCALVTWGVDETFSKAIAGFYTWLKG